MINVHKAYKKAGSILISALVLLSSLSGCGGDDKSQTMKQNGNMQQSLTIRWAGTPNMAVEKDSEVQKYLEQKFGVKIDPVSITTNYTDKLAAMIASNDIPDIMFMPEPTNWQPLAAQGVLAVLSEEMIKTDSPNLYKLIQEADPHIFAVCKDKGKMWAIPKIMGDEYNTAAIWRKDWLEKVGITKLPETLEEYETALTKFRDEDPDGNGKKDTYGFTSMGNHPVRQFDTIFGAFGVMPGQWRVVDGKVVMSTIMPQAKQVLALLHQWYVKGIIDPEFITDNVRSTLDKQNAGRIGLIFASAVNWHPSMPVGRENLEAWKKKNPNAKFEIGPIPSGPEGKRGDWLWGPRSNFIVFSVKFGEKKSNITKVMKMLDTMLSDEETALRVAWGEKGKSYDYNDPQKGPSSGLKTLPPYFGNVSETAKAGIGLAGFYNMYAPNSGWASPENVNKYQPKEITELNEKIAHWKQGSDALLRPNLPSTQKYQANLDVLKSISYSTFVTGEKSLGDWDSFVQEWLDKGGKQLTEEAQQFYDNNFK